MVFLSYEELPDEYETKIKIQASGRLACSVMIICANEVDAMSSTRMLTQHLRDDNIAYTVRPVSNFDQIKQHYKQKTDSIKIIFMINCGAVYNIKKAFDLEGSDTQVYIMDNHRPIHLSNIKSRNDVVVIGDGNEFEDILNLDSDDGSDFSEPEMNSDDESSIDDDESSIDDSVGGSGSEGIGEEEEEELSDEGDEGGGDDVDYDNEDNEDLNDQQDEDDDDDEGNSADNEDGDDDEGGDDDENEEADDENIDGEDDDENIEEEEDDDENKGSEIEGEDGEEKNKRISKKRKIRMLSPSKSLAGEGEGADDNNNDIDNNNNDDDMNNGDDMNENNNDIDNDYEIEIKNEDEGYNNSKPYDDDEDEDENNNNDDDMNNGDDLNENNNDIDNDGNNYEIEIENEDEGYNNSKPYDDDEDEDENRVVQRRRRTLENRYDKSKIRKKELLRYYHEDKNYSSPTSFMILNLVWGHRKSLDTIWQAILGVTDQFHRYRISENIYKELCKIIKVQLQDHLDNASNRIKYTVGDGDLQVVVPGAETGHIEEGPEFRFFMYRHWSLFDSMYYSPYIATKISIWTPEGVTNLNELLAKIGLPLQQCKQSYNFMNPTLRNHFRNEILNHQEQYKLQSPDLMFRSFFRYNSFKNPIAATDVVFSSAALLELCKTVDLDENINVDNENIGNSISASDQSSRKNAFNEAYDCLSMKSDELLKKGKLLFIIYIFNYLII
jgi:hypothetical protein